MIHYYVVTTLANPNLVKTLKDNFNFQAFKYGQNVFN